MSTSFSIKSQGRYQLMAQFEDRLSFVARARGRIAVASSSRKQALFETIFKIG